MDMGFTDVWGDGTDEKRGLRPLGWAELCARLIAAQDLRRAVRPPGASPPGLAGAASFHRPAAEMLLDVASMGSAGAGKRPINQWHSEIGKADSGTLQSLPEASPTVPPDCPTRRENP